LHLVIVTNGPGRYPPLTLFEHYDHGKDADPSFPDLFPEGKGEVDDLTPTIGSDVHGIQLSQLTAKGKDQLALFVAQRKVVGTLRYIKAYLIMAFAEWFSSFPGPGLC
jgi:sulfonate dioxygenase